MMETMFDTERSSDGLEKGSLTADEQYAVEQFYKNKE